MPYVQASTGQPVHGSVSTGFYDYSGNAVDISDVARTGGTRRRVRRIVISETTLKGIAAIMRLARSGRAPGRFQGPRRRSRSF
jgi:hypothetical protein